jgi:hypothetical protein
VNVVNHAHGRPARLLPPLYVAAWATLAALALAYLALMVVRPDVAEGLFQRLPLGSPEDNRGQRAVARLTSELRDLKQTIKHLETEVSDLRLTAVAAERANAALTARVTVVENGLKSVLAPQAHVAGAADPGKVNASPAVAGYLEERAAAASWPAEASRATAAAPLTPARPAPASGPPVALQLATAPSLDALRLSWQLLQERHSSIVRGLEPRFVETPGDPPSYRLLAGPRTSSDEANKLCERLRSRRVTCAVVPFAGRAL